MDKEIVNLLKDIKINQLVSLQVQKEILNEMRRKKWQQSTEIKAAE